MATSIFSRKRDLLYLIYFCTAVPMAFIVDLQPLYPPHLIPGWMLGITEYYIKTFNDQYFINEPVWFHFFMMSELFIQVPVMVWGIGALLRDSKLVPLVLLPLALLVFLTTTTCIFDIAHWDAPLQERLTLMGLYAPYSALPLFMAGDMFLRLKSVIDSSSVVSTKAGKKNR
ncbi:Transmembrane protein 6/97 [Hyaloscypha variabilis]|uniref:Efficient mitochondria targeting-associated protein 19 n=1 Tax=Hyaloscypha variabilis (strain UAMH 11265 / GT02V1 / F) TaxID=1149755 RepID=A0A2J6S8G5_HYAVF|nr:hypothetical protein L207DRAFT_448566 [Hyaloscypha variabilis F]